MEVFPEVPPPFVHEWLLQAFWFPTALLGAWEGHICPSFLVFFFVLPLSCPNPILAVLHASRISSSWQPLGIPAQFFPLGSLWSSDLGKLGLFFLPFVSWALRPFLSWILGIKSFGLTILFPCGELNPFIITFHGVDPLCYFFEPWCYEFLYLNNHLLFIV